MPLDKACSEDSRCKGGLQPHLVAGITNRAVELLLQRQDHAQVQLLGFAGVGTGAVRDKEAIPIEERDCMADLIHGGHPGG